MAKKKEKENPLKEKVAEALEKTGKVNVKKVTKKDKEEFILQLATRELLEKDFEEDTILVTFETKEGVKRTIEAKKPTYEEMLEIMNISIKAMKYEGKTDEKSINEMMKIYNKLPEIASKYSKDKTMDEEFWKTTSSFSAMMNFISELIIKVQVGGGNIPQEQMKSFRGK